MAAYVFEQNGDHAIAKQIARRKFKIGDVRSSLTSNGRRKNGTKFDRTFRKSIN